MLQLSSVPPLPPRVGGEGPPSPPVGFGSSGGLWSPWGLLRRGRTSPPVGFGPSGGLWSPWVLLRLSSLTIFELFAFNLKIIQIPFKLSN